MENSITSDPIIRALLKHLAEERGKNDPVGELSRELLREEFSVADLLRSSWYGAGLATAVEAGQDELSRMTPDQRGKLEEGAVRLGEVHGTDAGVDW